MKKLWTPLFIIAVLVGGYFLAAGIIDIKVHRERTALRAAGHPVTLDDLGPLFGSGSTDAADVLNRAAREFDKSDLGRLAGLDTLGRVTGQAGVREFLDEKATAYALLMQASGMGPARFGMDYKAGINARIADVCRSFNGFRMLLRLEARALDEAGRPDSALEVLTASFALADAFAEPALVYSLVGLVGLDSAAAVASRVAPRAGIDAIERLVARVERLDPKDRLVHGLESDGTMVQSALASGWMGWVDEKGNLPPVPFLAFLPLRRYSQACQLAALRKQLDILPRPWYEGYSLLREAPDTLPPRGILGRIGRYGVIDALVLYRRAERFAALRDVMVLGLRALELRKRTGRTPQSLAEFAPGAPADRFSGRPYVYRVLPDGFLVYSIGSNGTDDNGSPKDDIAFRVQI